MTLYISNKLNNMAKKKEQKKSRLEELDETHDYNNGININTDNETIEKIAIEDKKQDKIDLQNSIMLNDGWQPIDVKLLRNGGMYGVDKLYIKSASTSEIRHWSSIDENNPESINKHFHDIIKSCTKFIGGIKTWKDIKECDLLTIIMEIHNLTFLKPERPLKLEVKCSCGKKHNHTIKSHNLNHIETDDVYFKYYNEQNGIFELKTLDYGVVNITPPSIGVMLKFKEFVNAQSDVWIKKYKNFIEIMPYFVNDYRMINKDVISKLEIDYVSYDMDKYINLNDFVNGIKCDADYTVTTLCNDSKNCSVSTRSGLDFKEGIKAFFLPVSNRPSQLL